jgi:hypothetical protein
VTSNIASDVERDREQARSGSLELQNALLHSAGRVAPKQITATCESSVKDRFESKHGSLCDPSLSMCGGEARPNEAGHRWAERVMKCKSLRKMLHAIVQEGQPLTRVSNQKRLREDLAHALIQERHELSTIGSDSKKTGACRGVKKPEALSCPSQNPKPQTPNPAHQDRGAAVQLQLARSRHPADSAPLDPPISAATPHTTDGRCGLPLGTLSGFPGSARRSARRK